MELREIFPGLFIYIGLGEMKISELLSEFSSIWSFHVFYNRCCTFLLFNFYLLLVYLFLYSLVSFRIL